MEVALVVTAGALAGASCLVLLAPAEGRAQGPEGTLRVIALRARLLLQRLSRTWPVARAAEWRPVASLARDLLEREGARALGLGLEEACAALLCLLAVTSLLGGLLLASPVAGAVVGVLEVAAVLARESAGRRRERRETLSAMPGVYRTLAVALGSGQTLAQAVEYVGAHERGGAGAAFARASLRLRCGMGTEQVVDILADELEVPGARLLATALVISHRTGSPLADLLARSARLAERQGEFERLLAVKTAQVRLSVRIVCLLPAVMLALLALVSPDFQQGLLTPVGIGCVALAALLDLVALLLIRRMVSGVL